jgi:hypothetical protein
MEPMNDAPLHFEGRTIVNRGEWKMNVPVDFYLVINEEIDPGIIEEAALACAQTFTTSYVDKQDAKQAARMFSDDEESG